MRKVVCILAAVTLSLAVVLTLLPTGVQAVSKSFKEGEALVLLKGSLAPTKAKATATIKAQGEMTVEELWRFDSVPQGKATASAGKTFEDRSVVLVKSSKLTTSQLIKKLKGNKNVIKAEPNHKAKALSVTNDTYLDKQWAIDNTGQNGGTAGTDIKVDSIWQQGTKGTEKVVAVVDTGIDYNHEELAANMWENPYQGKLSGEHGYDFAYGDDDPMDGDGHGTHCAGIIGAAGNNGKGITGVNQSVKLMALKFLDDEGGGYISGAVSAYSYIYKALKLGIPVVAVNNSWGGAGDSDIMAEVINAVGAKGAISISAAGNGGSDIDDQDVAPAGVDSEYNITVAATNEKNQLATFSDYGKEKVDLAAPGVDILSSVSYNCFNPSLYDSDTDHLSSHFADFNDGDVDDVEWGVPKASKIYTDGSAETTAALDSESFFGNDGKSLKLKVSGAAAGDLIVAEVPYTVNATSEALEVSAMVKANGPKIEEPDDEEFYDEDDWDYDEAFSAFVMSDVAANKKITDIESVDMGRMGFSIFDGEDNFWDHYGFSSGVKKNAGEQERKLVFVFMCGSDTDEDYIVNIDDLAISKENVAKSQFGKYDFYNGTSMAAPQVTGAAALLRETMSKDAKADEVVNKVLGSINKVSAHEGKTASSGVLDFSKAGTVTAGPKISSVTVNTTNHTISIKGNRFVAGTSVKMGKTSVSSADVQIKSSREIIVKNRGWINRLLDITVTNSNGSSTKKNVYLVKGKTSYTLLKDQDIEFNVSAVGTDGKSLFAANATNKKLMKYSPSAKDFVGAVSINSSKLFKSAGSNFVKPEFRFGPDLASADNKIYNIGALKELAEEEEDYYDDGDDYYDDYYDDYDDYYEEESLFIEPNAYAADYKMIVMDPVKKAATAVSLPKEYNNITNQTIASYNGKIYLIGGYDYNKNKKGLSTLVKVYDPVKKKWSNGPGLPSGRASGRALQTGNSLVYSFGYAEGESCPKNLIFNGKKWTTSKKTIQPFVYGKTKVQGKDYMLYTGNMSLVKDGVLYSGTPTDGFGDTFTYHVKKDSFASTKYNLIDRAGELDFRGTVVGSTLYGMDHTGELYKVSGLKSGLVKVTAKKSRGGSIAGANRYVLPGSKVQVKAIAKKGYVLKYFKVSGKKIKGKSKTIRLTSNQTASATFVKKKK